MSATLGVESPMPLSKCIKTLQSRNLYAVIIADEIEQIYAGDDFPEKRKLVLDELTELGSTVKPQVTCTPIFVAAAPR